MFTRIGLLGQKLCHFLVYVPLRYVCSLFGPSSVHRFLLQAYSTRHLPPARLLVILHITSCLEPSFFHKMLVLHINKRVVYVATPNFTAPHMLHDNCRLMSLIRLPYETMFCWSIKGVGYKNKLFMPTYKGHATNMPVAW